MHYERQDYNANVLCRRLHNKEETYDQSRTYAQEADMIEEEYAKREQHVVRKQQMKMTELMETINEAEKEMVTTTTDNNYILTWP